MKKLTLLFSFLLFSLCVSAQTDEISDSTEIETDYNFTSGLSWLNSNLNNGIDLGGGSLLVFSNEISHNSGLYLNLTPSYLDGNWYNLSSSIGYDYDLSEWISLTGEYSYISFSDDSANTFASLNHLFSVSADFELPLDLSFGLSADYFPGTHSAFNAGVMFSGFYHYESFLVIPMLTADFISQDIENQFLKTGKKQKGKNGGTAAFTTGYSTVSGLSSTGIHLIVIYRLTNHFKAVLHPLYQFTPKSEISKSDSQFSISIGLKYSVDF